MRGHMETAVLEHQPPVDERGGDALQRVQILVGIAVRDKARNSSIAAVMLRNHDETVETIEHMFDGGNLISQIVDVHVQAEAGRLAYGLTPAVRIELECYFSRLPGGEQSRAISSDRLLDAMRSATRNAVATGRLPKDLDIEGFVSAIVLIWQGLSVQPPRTRFRYRGNAAHRAPADGAVAFRLKLNVSAARAQPIIARNAAAGQ